ncbi:MAG: DUF692 family multinuclear iron-containing protein [Bryobacteraceae bacterium]
MQDRFGLGWRPALSGAIFSNLDRIDVLEVIADDYFEAPRRKIQALRSLAAERPVMLHAVGLGMASTIRVDEKRLDAFARLVHHIEPAGWSEHLAFVRAGGVEIGYLAAPPRNGNTIEGTLANVDHAARRIGAQPAMENVASLIDPPGSTLSEAQWLSRVIGGSRAGLLLDLHNVYANSINFGYDPSDFLQSIPLDRVGTIHLAGGKWIGGRMLDDHLHDVPDPVFGLLREVAQRVQHPLIVILERDGAYPGFDHLLRQLDLARAAVAEGRRAAAA